MPDQAQLVRILEGALLAAGRPLNLAHMAKLFDQADCPDEQALRKALDVLDMECEGRAYELREVATGYRIHVRDKYSDWVARLWEERPPRYSRALLETLALIAYRQPVTRGDIEKVRGVSLSQNIIKTLQEREWIRVVGYKDVPGRPALYATTRQFLDYFNLKKLEELPSLAEIRDLSAEPSVLDLEAQEVEQEKAAADAAADSATEETKEIVMAEDGSEDGSEKDARTPTS